MQRLGARWAVHQLAAAVGAAVIQILGAFGAEGTFERADEGAGRFGGKADTAHLAIGAHFEHVVPFLSSRNAHGFADRVDDLFDLFLIVALGHHPDHRLGA